MITSFALLIPLQYAIPLQYKVDENNRLLCNQLLGNTYSDTYIKFKIQFHT